ncbi:MAG: hypothetical protein QXO37_06835 [Candidatus Nitrosocaldaceae archaeon]
MQETSFTADGVRYIVKDNASEFRIVCLDSSSTYYRIDISLDKVKNRLTIMIYGVNIQRIIHNLTDFESRAIRPKIEEAMNQFNEARVEELYYEILATYTAI